VNEHEHEHDYEHGNEDEQGHGHGNNIDMDEVCSESNAQGEITSIQNILEPRLFQDFVRPPQR
jgi:hypothetical protein